MEKYKCCGEPLFCACELKDEAERSPVERVVRELGKFKADKRPQRRAWAPGNYYHECCVCGEAFIGDKRAVECADCAYDDIDENAHSF